MSDSHKIAEIAQRRNSQAGISILQFPGQTNGLRLVMIRFVLCPALTYMLNLCEVSEIRSRDSISEDEESSGKKGHEEVEWEIELSPPPSKRGPTTGVLKGSPALSKGGSVRFPKTCINTYIDRGLRKQLERLHGSGKQSLGGVTMVMGCVNNEESSIGSDR